MAAKPDGREVGGGVGFRVATVGNGSAGVEPETQQEAIERLTMQLISERQLRHRAEAEVERLKDDARRSIVPAQMGTEGGLTSTLMENLEEARKDKERVVVEVDREEEYITNVLQKRLTELQREKAKVERDKHALEAELSRERASHDDSSLDSAGAGRRQVAPDPKDKPDDGEEPYRLQAKLTELKKEKERLEGEMEEERASLVQSLHAQMLELEDGNRDLVRKHHSDAATTVDHLYEGIVRLHREASEEAEPELKRLLDDATRLRVQVIVLVNERKALKDRNLRMEEDVSRLQTENFVLGQRVTQEHELAEERRSAASAMVSRSEADSERQFNVLTRTDGVRSRTASMEGSVDPPHSPSASVGLSGPKMMQDIMLGPSASHPSRADLAEAELTERARRASSVSSQHSAAVAAAAAAVAAVGGISDPMTTSSMPHTDSKGRRLSGGSAPGELSLDTARAALAHAWPVRSTPPNMFGGSGATLGMPPNAPSISSSSVGSFDDHTDASEGTSGVGIQ